MEKTILKLCIERGFLVDREMLKLLAGLDEESVKQLIDYWASLKVGERILTRALLSKHFQQVRHVLEQGKNKTIIENFFVNLGYSKLEIEGTPEENAEAVRQAQQVQQVQQGQQQLLPTGTVKVLASPALQPKKIEVSEFVNHFRARYAQLSAILQEKNLENLTSIRKIEMKRGNYTIIGSIMDKRITKNKNLLLIVEDLTGTAKVLVNHNKKEVFDAAKDLLLDDVVAFKVSGDREWLYANEVIFPDCYLQEKKRASFEEWAAFSSDWHVGSMLFLEEPLLKFIRWLNGEEGDEHQRAIAKKVKYLFMTGDCVDGVGIHPVQEPLLKIKDMKSQYKKLAELVRMIRKDIKIILCPGQHDSVRVAEPQPPIQEEYAPDLYKIENLVLVPNPAVVEIDGGFRVLMYHGDSLSDVANEIEEIRLNYKHNFPTRIVKELLKRRHLAPMHGSVIYVPNEKEDYLVIKNVPDIIATGDLHKSDVSVYNNVLMIASSCWQSTTPFEEKVGNNPEPGKVPILNLKTREIKILDFIEREEKENPRAGGAVAAGPGPDVSGAVAVK